MSTDNEHPVKDKTTVHIEKTDESWALKLLNESQSEACAMGFDETKHKPQPPVNMNCDNNVLDIAENKIDTHITVNGIDSDEATLRLSAIENQIFTYAQKKYENKETEKKGLLVTPLSKIRSFFAA